jgi:GNAT superfamily N-acetyltransferase
VGVLVEADPTTWSVRRRDGSVTAVDVAKITAGRVVPPGRAERASVAEVQRIAALGWRALERQPLGEWLLRAGNGFTGRANSALALPARIQLVDREAPDGLREFLDTESWAVSPDVYVMTAELGHVLRAAPTTSSLEIRLDATPDDGWLSCYRQDGGTLPAAARDILTNHPAAVFASIRDSERVVAIARASVDDRWAGLFAVEVAPDARGHGLGAIISGAALRWATERGARRTYLQVSVDNAPAVRLYERLNYAVHHHYVYRDRSS